MRTKILACLFLGFLLTGCSEDVKTIVGTDIPVQNGTVILVSSFESNGVASWDDWINPGPPVVKIASEAPPSGGKYSIFLKARDAGAIVYKVIPVETGKHKYSLSFWAKATEDPGSLDLYLKSGTEKVNFNGRNIESSDWSEYKIETEYTAAQGDSLVIYMSGSSFVVPQGFTFFDNIILRKMD